MNFKIGDYVTRISHQNDVVFKIINIEKDIAYLKGVNLRLVADSLINDLVIVKDVNINDEDIIDNSYHSLELNRDQYFYLPGTILHIDGDEE